jgi:hypothetical protein
MRATGSETRRMQSHERSPWRVFVREERETKTAKSRLMELIRSGDRWPLMFLKRSDRSA